MKKLIFTIPGCVEFIYFWCYLLPAPNLEGFTKRQNLKIATRYVRSIKLRGCGVENSILGVILVPRPISICPQGAKIWNIKIYLYSRHIILRKHSVFLSTKFLFLAYLGLHRLSRLVHRGLKCKIFTSTLILRFQKYLSLSVFTTIRAD